MLHADKQTRLEMIVLCGIKLRKTNVILSCMWILILFRYIKSWKYVDFKNTRETQGISGNNKRARKGLQGGKYGKCT